MGKKINKNKIVKYAATGLLVTTLAAGCGIAIHDASIDHTNSVCSITRSLMTLGTKDSVLFNCGVNHQINQMTDEYERLGYSVSINFNDQYYQTETTTTTVQPVMNYDSETGEIRYVAPMGYTLIEENGQYYALKKTTSKSDEPEAVFDTKLTKTCYANVEITDDKVITVPIGYALVEENGRYYAVKEVVTHKVLKLK